MYEFDLIDGKWCVRSLFDNTLITSRETGKIIAFEDIDKAIALYDVLMKNGQAIAEANSYWIHKEIIGTYRIKE